MISPEVMQELLAVRQVLHYLPESQSTEKGWTPHEQQLFWVALTTFPQGPWTAIAEYIGTKTTRQAMTHAQKLRQKLKRWNSRLRSNPTVSSLMDGVTVTADGNVTVSAGALSNIAPTHASFPPPPSSGELESKNRQQHGASYNATSIPVSYNVAPLTLNQAQARPPMFDHLGTLPPNSPVSFMLGLRTHSGSTSAEAMANNDTHDILDELTKALSEEDASENEEEITEEELKELDDGDLAD